MYDWIETVHRLESRIEELAAQLQAVLGASTDGVVEIYRSPSKFNISISNPPANRILVRIYGASSPTQSLLTEAADSDATSLSISPAIDPDSSTLAVPFEIILEGEQMTVTEIDDDGETFVVERPNATDDTPTYPIGAHLVVPTLGGYCFFQQQELLPGELQDNTSGIIGMAAFAQLTSEAVATKYADAFGDDSVVEDGGIFTTQESHTPLYEIDGLPITADGTVVVEAWVADSGDHYLCSVRDTPRWAVLIGGGASSITTTTSGTLDVGSTTLNVDDGSEFPTAPFNVTIGSEIIRVTDKGTGTDWTVTRNLDSTPFADTASISSGATVTLELMQYSWHDALDVAGELSQNIGGYFGTASEDAYGLGPAIPFPYTGATFPTDGTVFVRIFPPNKDIGHWHFEVPRPAKNLRYGGVIFNNQPLGTKTFLTVYFSDVAFGGSGATFPNIAAMDVSRLNIYATRLDIAYGIGGDGGYVQVNGTKAIVAIGNLPSPGSVSYSRLCIDGNDGLTGTLLDEAKAKGGAIIDLGSGGTGVTGSYP